MMNLIWRVLLFAWGGTVSLGLLLAVGVRAAEPPADLLHFPAEATEATETTEAIAPQTPELIDPASQPGEPPLDAPTTQPSTPSAPSEADPSMQPDAAEPPPLVDEAEREPEDEESEREREREPESQTERESEGEPEGEPDLEIDLGEPEASVSSEVDENRQLLIQGDRLWQEGRFTEAEQLYRQAKGAFTEAEVRDRPEPIFDPALLPPGGQVYWREAQAGRETNLTTRILVPLELLSRQHPHFIPGHIHYAEALLEQGQTEAALSALEHAATLYPNQPELIRYRVTALASQKQWLEASIAARQFATLYPDDPHAPDFTAMAEEYLGTFKGALRSRLTGNAIANILTGALGYALTGGLFGPLSAIETTALLLRGEANVGERFANRAARQLNLIEDDEITSYVNDIGQRLAAVAGRNEFEYEFYVVRDSRLNAFALPGGKIFINAGAIAQTNSEAELAGLIAHELAHAVLSHGFQLVTGGTATANLLQLFPYGGLATDLIVLDYGRDMERQADTLGTRILTAAGYAADGLHNLMVTLSQQERRRPRLSWFSSHPEPAERIRNLERLIQQNGYNRYAYEGVERHQQIQQRVEQLMSESSSSEPEQEN